MFENQYTVKKYLIERTKKINDKDSFYSDCTNNKSVNSKDYGLLTQADITDELLIRITNTAKQAREFYFASINLPMLSKPIILVYALEKLCQLLALCTFKIPFTEQVNNTVIEKRHFHGVSYRNKIIELKKNGWFQLFHDCYSNDSSIYDNPKPYNFKLEDLLRIGFVVWKKESNFISYADIFNLMRRGTDTLFKITLKEYSPTESLEIHEPDREFLFIYALSTLARYQVKEWSEMLDGIQSDLILKIKEYTQTIESTFPNLVLDYLFETIFLFVPLAYLQKDDIKQIVKDMEEENNRFGIGGYR